MAKPYKMPATIDDPAILVEMKEDLKEDQILKKITGNKKNILKFA